MRGKGKEEDLNLLGAESPTQVEDKERGEEVNELTEMDTLISQSFV